MTTVEGSPRLTLAALSRGFLGGVALAGVGLLVVAALHFRSVEDSRALLWYGIAIGLALFGLIGRRLRPAWRVTLMLVSATTILSLLAGEWVLETLERRQAARVRAAVEKLTGFPRDPRSIPEVVRDLQRAGVAAVPSVVPKVMLDYTAPGTPPGVAFTAPFMPLTGVSRAETVQLCNEDGRYHRYRSDRYGFNNPDTVWAATGPRLVLIGDSFVHGYCVPSDSTLPSFLRQGWPATISLGAGGSGPLSELGILTEYGQVARPAVILWVYFENDLPDLAFERGLPNVARYLNPGFGQRLAERQPAVDSNLRAWITALYARGLAPDPLAVASGWRPLATLTSLRALVGRTRQGRPADPRDQVPLFRQVLTRAAEQADSLQARMVFVFLPSWERFFLPPAPSDLGRPEVLATVRSLGLPTIDLAPAFARHPDRARLFGRRGISNAHYSSLGYGFVAALIQRALDSLPGGRPE